MKIDLNNDYFLIYMHLIGGIPPEFALKLSINWSGAQ